MQRITKANLEALCDSINRATGSPEAAYTKDASGNYRGNPGNYHLDWAYGGVRIVRMCNEGGGITTVTEGFRSKRETYDLGHAYLRGIRDASEPVTA